MYTHIAVEHFNNVHLSLLSCLVVGHSALRGTFTVEELNGRCSNAKTDPSFLRLNITLTIDSAGAHQKLPSARPRRNITYNKLLATVSTSCLHAPT